MRFRLHEIRRLSKMLEAEVEGRPFDSHEARSLAEWLAKEHPEIGRSMALISERLRAEALV